MDDYHDSGAPPSSRQICSPDVGDFDPELWHLLSAMLETCCNLLDPPDAELFRRAHIKAQSPNSIAEATGLSIVEVETRLVSAQQKLFAVMARSLSPDA